jgi:hypothetical protein
MIVRMGAFALALTFGIVPASAEENMVKTNAPNFRHAIETLKTVSAEPEHPYTDPSSHRAGRISTPLTQRHAQEQECLQIAEACTQYQRPTCCSGCCRVNANNNPTLPPFYCQDSSFCQ